MIITLYDILGISSTASSAEIKTAYKKLAKQYHPDKNPGSNWHEEQFKKVNQAYQILSDPSQRQVYDYRLEYERFNQQRPVTPKPPPQQQRTPPTSKTQTQYNYQKKKQESQYQKPPSVQETWLDKFFETIFRPIKSLSEKKINMYVVSYYFFSVMLLGSYYEFLDSTKTTELFELAEIHENIMMPFRPITQS
jgi:curved DNA-binding protein CbpA